MNLSVTGLPAIAIAVGFIAVFSAPVWVAARVVGANSPTFARSAMSLVVGAVGSVVSAAVGGGWALLLAPLSFLIAFKYILGTSFLGSIVLAVVAVAGYTAMVHFIGGGVHFSSNGPAT